jgi:hypothetical protein
VPPAAPVRRVSTAPRERLLAFDGAGPVSRLTVIFIAYIFLILLLIFKNKTFFESISTSEWDLKPEKGILYE